MIDPQIQIFRNVDVNDFVEVFVKSGKLAVPSMIQALQDPYPDVYMADAASFLILSPVRDLD